MKSSACSIAMLVSALVVAVSGCSTQPQQPGQLTDSPSVSSNATQSSAQSADEQAVIDAYKGYFEVFQVLGAADADTVRQILAPYSAGLAVERAAAAMATMREKGREPGGTVVFGEIAVTINGALADTSECRDASTETVLDSATQKVIASGNPRSLIQAKVEKQVDGRWKVIDYSLKPDQC